MPRSFRFGTPEDEVSKGIVLDFIEDVREHSSPLKTSSPLKCSIKEKRIKIGHSYHCMSFSDDELKETKEMECMERYAFSPLEEEANEENSKRANKSEVGADSDELQILSQIKKIKSKPCFGTNNNTDQQPTLKDFFQSRLNFVSDIKEQKNKNWQELNSSLNTAPLDTSQVKRGSSTPEKIKHRISKKMLKESEEGDRTHFEKATYEYYCRKRRHSQQPLNYTTIDEKETIKGSKKKEKQKEKGLSHQLKKQHRLSLNTLDFTDLKKIIKQKLKKEGKKEKTPSEQWKPEEQGNGSRDFDKSVSNLSHLLNSSESIASDKAPRTSQGAALDSQHYQGRGSYIFLQKQDFDNFIDRIWSGKEKKRRLVKKNKRCAECKSWKRAKKSLADLILLMIADGNRSGLTFRKLNLDKGLNCPLNGENTIASKCAKCEERLSIQPVAGKETLKSLHHQNKQPNNQTAENLLQPSLVKDIGSVKSNEAHVTINEDKELISESVTKSEAKEPISHGSPFKSFTKCSVQLVPDDSKPQEHCHTNLSEEGITSLLEINNDDLFLDEDANSFMATSEFRLFEYEKAVIKSLLKYQPDFASLLEEVESLSPLLRPSYKALLMTMSTENRKKALDEIYRGLPTPNARMPGLMNLFSSSPDGLFLNVFVPDDDVSCRMDMELGWMFLESLNDRSGPMEFITRDTLPQEK